MINAMTACEKWTRWRAEFDADQDAVEEIDRWSFRDDLDLKIDAINW
jgi:hypothetical protein